MILPQLFVILLLLEWQRPLHAIAVLLLILGQLKLMQRFVASPAERALQLSAFGVPLLVTGMMVAAFALRGLGG
jgi:chlorophyll synthase